MSFCNNCNKEIVENAKFCSACGTEVASVNADVDSSSNDKQEKVFFKYKGVHRELMISNELIKCTYRKFLFTERIFIISRSINSFECKSFASIRILGGILVAIPILFHIYLLFLMPTGYINGDTVRGVSINQLQEDYIIISLISVLFFVIGLPRIFLKPKIEVYSRAKKYPLPISIFGSKEDILNAIQSAVSYKK
jgi:hypothetical protein